MRERIRELASGQVEVNAPQFIIQPEKLEDELSIDGLHRADIYIEVQNQVMLKGVAYSSHSRVHVTHPTFFGRRCSISLEINTVGLSGQGIIEGVITLETNAGERTIPYSFRMQDKGYGLDGRVIRSLEDYADYALEDEKGAVRLFRSRSFCALPFMREIGRMTVYQALSAQSDDRRNLEEFLTYTGAKEPVGFETETGQVKLEEVDKGEFSVIIRKNTWGYGILNIHTDKPFIKPLEECVSTDSFTSDDNGSGICELKFEIKTEHLCAGVNEGTIIIKSAKEELRIPVSVSAKKKTKLYVDEERQKRNRFTYELMSKYVRYRIEKLDGKQDVCLEELTQLAAAQAEEYPDEWERKLYLIYFQLLSGKLAEADANLDSVRDEAMKNRVANVRAYCFFLYLRAMFNNSSEQMDTAAKLITKYYNENEQSPELMLLLIRADSAYRENQSLSLLRLKELYMDGCNSPILYLDACENYRKCPDLLRVLNDFELKTVYFGARKGILSKELAITAARVSSFEKKFNPFTFNLLSNIYKKFPQKEILESILGYLIRCGVKKKEFFKWFEEGVKEELAIVGLNESYINTLPDDWSKPIPQALMLYFAYSQDLRGDIKEILYENILKFYGEDTQIFKEYEEQMKEYALTQLLAGRISRKLVPLYRHLLLSEMIDEKLATVLPDLLLGYEIKVNAPDIVKVIIRSPELSYEDTYNLEGGICLAPVYTEDSLFMFIDAWGNRSCDVSYSKELLFDQPQLLKKCEEVCPDYIIFLVRRCMEVLKGSIRDEQELELMNKVLNSADVSVLLKSKLVSKMLDYYFAKKLSPSEEFLKNLDMSALLYHDRRKALECMLMSGDYKDVYEYISENSINGLKYDSLLKLAENRLKEIKAENEQYLLELCVYLFGKEVYSPATLVYICRYYNAPDEQMKRILFFCYKNSIPVDDMAERLLAQMLFTGDIEEIKSVYEVYEKTCEVKESVQRAYIVICCYYYFVKDLMIDERVFSEIVKYMFSKDVRELLRAEYENNDIINIALLYYFTKNKNVHEKQQEISGIILNRLCGKGLLFGFYSLLWNSVEFPSELNGKVLLEHRTACDGRVFITMKRSTEDEPVTIQMKEMYDGIYVTEVVLFADETLEYIIQEERDGVLADVTEKELAANDMAFVRKGSTFDSINELGMLFASGQDNLLEDALVKYETRQYILKEIFRPL